MDTLQSYSYEVLVRGQVNWNFLSSGKWDKLDKPGTVFPQLCLFVEVPLYRTSSESREWCKIYILYIFDWMIVLGFNDMSTLVGHFVSSPREREKRDRRDSRRDEREGQGRKRNKNESEETEEIKTFPIYPYLLQGQQALPNCKPISSGRPGEVRYTTPSHHPTYPLILFEHFQMSSISFVTLRHLHLLCSVTAF